MKNEFETERLILRHFRESDINDFYEYASDEEVALRAGFPPHTDIEASLAFLKKTFIPSEYIYALELKSEHKVIGAIEIRDSKLKNGFVGLDLPENTHELGASLNAKYWSQGYMSEAANKLIEYAFEELNSEGVYATTSSRNFGSQKLQENCGLRLIDEVPRDKNWVDGSENVTQRRGITREEYYNNKKSLSI